MIGDVEVSSLKGAMDVCLFSSGHSQSHDSRRCRRTDMAPKPIRHGEHSLIGRGKNILRYL